jgi:hypothetical protein
MPAKTLSPSVHTLYDQDFVAWAEETAALLRQRRFDDIDVENLIEEVEAMAGRDKRELSSRIRVVILHLLKWRFQPEQRSGSWRSTLLTQRFEIRILLAQSPSLKRQLERAEREVYADARQSAVDETGLPEQTFPPECPFSIDQILDRSYLPE